MPPEFKNEPLTDFSQDEHRRAMAQAIAAVAQDLGQSYPMVIGGERITLSQTFASVNPSYPPEVVGTFPNAGPEHADQALEAANRAFASWKTVPAAARADLLFETAAAIRRRRFEFAAWMCFEAGKNWVEADADVAEAIDFLEFYGREALRHADAGPLTPVAGEDNRLVYLPLGAGVIIPPWNFPLAIVVGMSSAAIAAGNTVVLKPAPATPTVAWKYVEAFAEAGLPAGVLNFVTHDIPSTEAVGNRLVAHPQTRFVSFTGSKQVGLHIAALAAQTQPGQRWIKRVVAEMGGKDAIVVDREADLDTAAQGIVASAFGFSGQKCSACSRAIVHEDVHDALVERIVARTKQLRVGPGVDFETDVGPVIDTRAVKKILDYVEIGKQEGRLVLGGKGPEEGQGYFIEPTIFVDVPNEARISKEEIFGPVLAITNARDFDEAIAFANDTEYGLTGAVYSDNAQHLAEATERFHVGNLYLNRKCTGALVGAHPFGGFNMSGTDSKAGGTDYLLLFLQAKTISRKV
ncbi:MAG: L-glutamate gamma-semialdehyde dehydrogenase [Planctomycetota bacterium]|jgi:1-pyrroline-5-carboxylate dehydrogenase